MEEMQLLPFKNGKYLIKNVPHQLKKGEPYLNRNVLLKIAELTDYMVEHSIFETDFKAENVVDEKEVRKLAKFELNRYASYCQQLKNGSEKEQQLAKEKIILLDNVVEKIENYRGKEIIRERFLHSCSREFKDDFIVMKELKMSRTLYYSEKSEALKEVGLRLMEVLGK